LAERIKGITVVLGGDTGPLSKALSGVNKEINNTQKELKDVERLLKLDPTNTELLEQRQKLLANAVSETKTKLDTLKEAEKQAQEQFAQGKISQEQYDGLKREIVATEQQLELLEKAATKSNAVLAKVGETADKISEATGKMAQKTKALSGIAAGALTGAAAMSISFEDSFAKTSTLLDKNATDFETYKDSILLASDETAIAAGEFAEAVYSAISASVEQEKAVQFTTDAVKLAKGGFTDLTKAVDVLTTAINGYQMSADEAEKISDLLINTQNLGKVTVDELANSMGKVIPIAASANFTIEELSAAYALMTKNGIKADETGTYLKSMLNELSKTGSVTDKALRKLSGKGFAQLRAEGVPTADILNMLSDYAKEDNKTLKDMFGSVEAGSAALMLARDSGQEFNDMLKQMNTSTGQTQQAFDTVTSTTGQKMQKSFNQMKNAAIQMGDALAPVIEKIAGALQWLGQKLAGLDQNQMKTLSTVLMVIAGVSPVLSLISKISGGIGGLISIIGTLVTTVLPAIGTAVSSLVSFLIANPIALIIAAIVGFVALIANFGEEIKECLNGISEFLNGIFTTDWSNAFGVLGNFVNAFFANIKNIWESIKRVFTGIIDFIRGVFTANWEQVWKGVQDIFGGLMDGLVALIKAPINGIIGILNACIDGINMLINGLNMIHFDVPDWVPVLGGKSFGFSIPLIGKIPYLAKGGILSSGSAIVGEQGPELLTMMGGRAMVQPLSGNQRTGTAITQTNYFNNYKPRDGAAVVRDLNRQLGWEY